MVTTSSRQQRSRAIARRDFLKLGAGAGAMMTMTNTRQARAQDGAGRPGIVDVHAHWHPQTYVDAMKALGRTERPIADNPLNVNLDQRLKWMDEQGVETHCLTILTPAVQWAPGDVGARLARIVNDAAIAAHEAHPTRFVAGVATPVQDPKRSLEELNRVAGNPAFRGLHLPNSHNGEDYVFEPDFEPILARCQELGLPLLFHPLPGGRIGGDRLEGPSFLTNSVGIPFEHATTAAKFITTGTLDKFPTLDIVLPHMGGAFPYLAGRIEHGLARRGITMPRPFREYIRRFHYDTITYYSKTLRFLVNLVGADRVVVGTDRFARMDLEDPAGLVESLNLPPADRDLIIAGNAKRLFKMS